MTATLEKNTTFTCPRCGETQPVADETLTLIEAGEVTVCGCEYPVVSPSPGPAMPKELQVMPV